MSLAPGLGDERHVWLPSGKPAKTSVGELSRARAPKRSDHMSPRPRIRRKPMAVKGPAAKRYCREREAKLKRQGGKSVRRSRLQLRARGMPKRTKTKLTARGGVKLKTEKKQRRPNELGELKTKDKLRNPAFFFNQPECFINSLHYLKQVESKIRSQS